MTLIERTKPAAPLAARSLASLFGRDEIAPATPGLKDPMWAWLGQAVHRTDPVQSWSSRAGDTRWLLVMVPDQPFLTDTLLLTLRGAQLAVEALWHPVVAVQRGPKGEVQRVRVAKRMGKGAAREAELWALVQVVVPLAKDAVRPVDWTVLEGDVRRALAQAQAVVRDFGAMRSVLGAMAEEAKDADDAKLLQWLNEGGLIILGASGARREHQVALGISRTLELGPVLGRSAGILKLRRLDVESPVHRAAPLLALEMGGRQVVGLLASTAYTHSVTVIPRLRQVVKTVLKLSGWTPGSQRYRSLVNVLATWPRDELFLTAPEALWPLAQAAVAVREQPEVKVLVRWPGDDGVPGGLVSVMMYLPLPRMRTRVLEAIQGVLAAQLGGPVAEYRVEMGGDTGHELARLFFLVRWDGRAAAAADVEAAVQAEVRGWEDELRAALAAAHGRQAAELAQQVVRLGGPVYVASTTPEEAVADVAFWQGDQALDVRVRASAAQVTLRLVRRGAAWPLAQLMPVIDSCGLVALDEQNLQLGPGVSVQVIACAPCPALHEALAREALVRQLRAQLAATEGASPEVDSLNRLSVRCGFGPEILAQFRAWVVYVAQVTNQVGPRLDGRTVRYAVWGQPALAKLLWAWFEAVHNPTPARGAEKAAKTAKAQLLAALATLPGAEEERIWRLLAEVVDATLRSNFWSVRADEALAFKLDPKRLTGMPAPAPWREVFVHHPRVEGLHLRGGPVARGGIRHSDRAHDYRTEVLGLMVAQMRKNTIIVPVGAKGGFFIKATLPQGPARGAAIEAEYARYVRALLSVSDTYGVGGKVVQPAGVVCLDAADPYLVVAADKGTAKFSDLANRTALAADYWPGVSGGFWLGDAFASGGSQGYDHKGMGITAKGALISVRQHLQRVGRVPTTDKPLTVVAIGDMGGDVCGNGLIEMCRMITPHVRVVGAFNHAQILVDPKPDAAKSLAERQRLFAAGQDWTGYDRSKLSAGGEVFLRSAKRVEPSAPARAALGLKGSGPMTPDQLIAGLLKAPVDVIWNGGIGTYIRASDETDAAVQDKANDAVRVSAPQVRALVIGEGGNLGITPKGRVQLASLGVQLNTDALDNSAGVDTSDHEVNLKIALTPLVRSGRLDEARRNALIAQVEPVIERLVLADNTAQNLAVSALAQLPTSGHNDLHAWQGQLVTEGFADLRVDALPSLKDLQAREGELAGKFLRPELCALLAASKAWLRAQLAEGDGSLESTPQVQFVVAEYFSSQVTNLGDEVTRGHALRRELVQAQVVNQIINRLGVLLVPQLAHDHHVSPLQALEAVLLAVEVVDGWALWSALDEANDVPAATLLAAQGRVADVVRLLAAGLVQQQVQGRDRRTLGARWEQLGALRDVRGLLPELARPESLVWEKDWRAKGCPAEVAKRLSVLTLNVVLPEALALAQRLKRPLAEILPAYARLGAELQLPKLVSFLQTLPQPDTWQRQAVQAAVREVFALQGTLCAAAAGQPLERDLIARFGAQREALLASKTPSLGQATVVLAALRGIIA